MGCNELRRFNTSFLMSEEFIDFLCELYPYSKHIINTIHNKEVIAIALFAITIISAIVKYFKVYIDQRFNNYSRSHGIRLSNSSNWSNSSQSKYDFTNHPVELNDGSVKIGNIIFDPNQILGKGCEGTFVYK